MFEIPSQIYSKVVVFVLGCVVEDMVILNADINYMLA